MPAPLILPATLMSLALVAYSLGVWAERVRRYLLPWHVGAFWLGLAFDAAGTEMMFRLARVGWHPGIHGFFGRAALALMAGHTLWATWVLLRGSAEARASFHRYSLAVWFVWLLPYFGGMLAGMGALGRFG